MTWVSYIATSVLTGRQTLLNRSIPGVEILAIVILYWMLVLVLAGMLVCLCVYGVGSEQQGQCGCPSLAERLLYAEVGNFRINPRFHPTLVGWNLGLIREFPTSADCRLLLLSQLLVTPSSPHHKTSIKCESLIPYK